MRRLLRLWLRAPAAEFKRAQVASPPGTQAPASRASTKDGEAEAEHARRLARERERRERERREELRREERATADRERAVERAEAERERERMREAERQRDAKRARQRELERDLDDGGTSDSDEARRLVLKRRRDARSREERRRWRAKELEEDAADRRREEQELLAAQRKREEEAARAARAPPPPATLPAPPAQPPPPAEPVPVDSPHLPTDSASPVPTGAWGASHLPPLAPHASLSTPVEPAAVAIQPEAVTAPPSLALGLGFLKRAPVKKTVVVSAPLFGEEEAVPQKRTLVPIEYTEEELRAALVNEYEAAEPSAAPADGGVPAAADALAGGDAKSGERLLRDARKKREKEERDAKKSLLSLIDAIPTTRAELFAHPVDWAVFDSERLADTVSSWAAKKVAELLGEAEPSLVEFIAAQTAAHCTPDALLTELQAVLDDEAEALVIKLWRLILFETLKRKHAG